MVASIVPSLTMTIVVGVAVGAVGLRQIKLGRDTSGFHRDGRAFRTIAPFAAQLGTAVSFAQSKHRRGGLRWWAGVVRRGVARLITQYGAGVTDIARHGVVVA